MKQIADLDMSSYWDILGDAYEYLIGQFASDSGKKQVSSIPLNQ